MILDCSRWTSIDLQRAFMHTDFRAKAEALRLRMTIIYGDRDASVPIYPTGGRYAELIPQSRLVVHEGAPHVVIHPTRPARGVSKRNLFVGKLQIAPDLPPPNGPIGLLVN